MSLDNDAHGIRKYGKRVFQVEPIGTERVRKTERHGSAFQLFTLWFGANLSIADFALGFLPVHLGLPWSSLIWSILVGNILGGLLLGLSAMMGPKFGLPQLMISRFYYGRVGGYLPALFNWVGSIGWFTVNNILCTYGLKTLFPGLSFLTGNVIMIVIQGLLAIYGYNLIHVFERWMAVVLGILFAIATAISVSRAGGIPTHTTATHPVATILIVVAATFSYIASWSPYASDYSRYLPETTHRTTVFWWTFIGSVLACCWLELLGAMVAIIVGPQSGNAIQSLASFSGPWAVPMVVAIILGGIASNVLNLYSNSLSAGALDIRLSRTKVSVVAMVFGLLFSILGAGRFESFYENFLLLLGYWVTPWVGVLVVAFFFTDRKSVNDGTTLGSKSKVFTRGLIAFLCGIVASVPFMSSTIYTGPIAKLLYGADISFYVGFVVAALVYLLLGLTLRLEKM